MADQMTPSQNSRRHFLAGASSAALGMILCPDRLWARSTTASGSAGAGLAEFALSPDAGWLTAPPQFLAGQQLDMKRYAQGFKGLDWVVPPISVPQLAQGAGPSFRKPLSGAVGTLWRNLPIYPTLCTTQVPGDWSAFKCLIVEVYSERATGDTITLGVLADNPSTPTLDYSVIDFAVNWLGWKTLRFDLGAFGKIGAPMGWANVTGLYLFSKTYRRSPSPYTSLTLGRITLDSSAAPSSAPHIDAAPSSDVIITGPERMGARVRLNHSEPEVAQQIAAGNALVRQPFFKGARALNGYNPRYDPGYVSFDPQGRAYIRNVLAIDTLNDHGVWHRKDMADAVRTYARGQNWTHVGCDYGEPMIRFDKGGSVYAIVNVEPLKPDGNGIDWHLRRPLLLYATRIDQPWQVYDLPGRIADFEKLDTHNSDALKAPPVITLTDYTYFADADQAGYLVLPIKNADGTLTIPAKIKFSPYALIGPVHSGGGNFVISKGEMIYIVFGYQPPPTPNTNGQMRTLDPAWLAHMPPIPADHPARRLTAVRTGHDGSKTVHASDGMPTFITSYNRRTGELSPAVFIGYGGDALDGHNWPAMTIDSKGNLHVLMNGHIYPVMYTHTRIAGDLNSWSDPIYVRSGAAESFVSYASLSCDPHDNLFSIVRCDTNYYNHRIAMLSKPAGGETWNAERNIVVPYTNVYHVWRHRVTLNPKTNRYYLTFAELDSTQFTHDEYLFVRFIWPDYEHSLTGKVGKNPADNSDNGLPPEDHSAPWFDPGQAEITVMAFDAQRNWRLATTSDFG